MKRPLLRALVPTTTAVVLLWTLVVWAVYAQSGAGSRSDGDGREGVREITIRVYAWGFSPRVVYVNPEDTVRFSVLSEDIEHGFAINELGVNLQLRSGKEVRSSAVKVNLPAGRYAIHCSIFCGIGHPSMKAKLVVGDPGPAPGSRAPWIASVLGLGAATAFALFAAGRREPGA